MRRLLLAASLLAAARAGRYRHIRKEKNLPTQHNESRAPKTPILYFHFHKAGGTSFCALFAKAGLHTLATPPRKSCNCNKGILGGAVDEKYGDHEMAMYRPGGATRLAQTMVALDLDVCMMEESWKFPTPDQLKTFAAEWHALGGAIATSFREPWGRFRSTFLREHGDGDRASNLTIGQFGKKDYAIKWNSVEAGHKWSSDHGVRHCVEINHGDNIASTAWGARNLISTQVRHRRNGKVAEAKSVAHNILKYGAYNRPNFYVRLLNGLAEPPGKDSKMGPRELQNALSVVEHIDYVFLLEGDLQPKIRRAMLGKDVDMPHVSNSYFSARALVTYPERRKQLPPTDHYKQRFLDANCADLSFYFTLVNKLRADKMCKGCSPPPPVPPHRFFRGNEGHPRPRCFNINEVKPHPSLWETMTGLWKGKDKKSLINAAIYLETHE